MQLARRHVSLFNENLIGFSGTQMLVEGKIELSLIMGTPPKAVHLTPTFIMVSAPSAYNAILGSPSLNAARAVVSTATSHEIPYPDMHRGSQGKLRSGQTVLHHKPRIHNDDDTTTPPAH